jgi:hypothetical protein
MTDSEYDRVKERLMNLKDFWRVIGIGWWHIRLELEREGIRQTDAQYVSAEQTFFRVSVDWRYMEATIHCSMPALATLDDETLEEMFVHELMHIMVNEMRSDAGTNSIDHEERVCQTLALGFCWLKKRLLEDACQATAANVITPTQEEQPYGSTP